MAVVNSSQELATSIMRLRSSPPIRILVMLRSRHCSSFIEVSIDFQKQEDRYSLVIVVDQSDVILEWVNLHKVLVYVIIIGRIRQVFHTADR